MELSTFLLIFLRVQKVLKKMQKWENTQVYKNRLNYFSHSGNIINT